MDAKQFFTLVARMREKQREYFRTKSSTALRESKELERIVDTEIERVNRIIYQRLNPKLPI